MLTSVMRRKVQKEIEEVRKQITNAENLQTIYIPDERFENVSWRVTLQPLNILPTNELLQKCANYILDKECEVEKDTKSYNVLFECAKKECKTYSDDVAYNLDKYYPQNLSQEIAAYPESVKKLAYVLADIWKKQKDDVFNQWILEKFSYELKDIDF